MFTQTDSKRIVRTLVMLSAAEIDHLRNRLSYLAAEERCDNINRNYRKRAQNRKWRFTWQQTWLLIDLLLNTGATPKDVINLKVWQFDLENQWIIFQAGPKLNREVIFQADLDSGFIEHLRQYLEDRGWTSKHDKNQKLFPSWHGNRIVQWHWARALEAANLPHRRITATRYTFARKLFAQTKSIELVKERLRLSPNSKADHFLLSDGQIQSRVGILYDTDSAETLQNLEFTVLLSRITMLPQNSQRQIFDHLAACLSR